MTAGTTAGGALRRDHLPWAVASAGVVALAVLSATAVSAGPGVQRAWILLVLAPLAEEAVFRAGLQEYLLQRLRTPLVANGLTALAFALAHVATRGEWASFAVFVPALLIGAVYERWGRLRLCVVLHASMNALWLVWSLPGAAQLGSGA